MQDVWRTKRDVEMITDGKKEGEETAHGRYLSGDALAGAVLQEEAHHLQVILLGCHVQGSEAILQNRQNARCVST